METAIQQFIFSSKWRVARHLLFWIFMYLDEELSYFGLTPPLELPQLLVLEVALDVAIVYMNLYLFIPRFLHKKKYLPYIICTFLSLVLSNGINYWAGSYYYEYENILSVHIGNLLFTLSVLGTAIAVKLGKYSIAQTQLRESLEKEKIRAELNYLKQQINPHFMFNVLNSLYVQSRTNQASVPSTIMQLSDLLRYQIYEAIEKDMVPLTKEIEFLKNYLDLEDMRRDNFETKWEVVGHPNSKMIEPLIFLPLIENAVKHSRSSSNSKTWIDVLWKLESDEIQLTVKNSIGDHNKNENGRFGLENLEKRLKLAYPGTHDISLISKDGTFIAVLALVPNELYNNR